MAQKKHEWDVLVDDILSYIVEESDYQIQAIKGGQNSPFEQPVSEDQKRQYYESQMYNDSGTPNEAGRQRVMQRIGIQNYIPLLQELEKSRGGKMQTEPPMSANPEYTSTGESDGYS